MAVGLTHHAVLALSRGSFGAREVWFTHEPLLSAHAYHRYFDGPVQFGKPFNAVFFNRRDLAQPIPDQDPQIYEMASSRSEEQTSELQSLMRITYAVFCVKKKTTAQYDKRNNNQVTT